MNTLSGEAISKGDDGSADPGTLRAFRRLRLLVGGYLTISVAALAAIVLMRHDTAAVTDAVWVRGTIVVVSAAVMARCVARAARGGRSAYRRLRVLSGVMVAAIAVIVALPGAFPVWMRIEQAVCGVLLLGVVITVNSGRLRGLFGAR